MNPRESRSTAGVSYDTGNGSGSKTATALYEAGLAHMQAGRPLDAQGCCRQALTVAPDHADSLHLMGIVCFAAKQYDLAIEWFARATQQNPNAADYFSNLGMALQRSNRFREAIKSFHRALVLKPDQAEIWFRMGESLRQLKRSQQAILSFEKALDIDPNHAGATDGSAMLHFEKGRYEQAIAGFDRLLQVRPDLAGAFKLKGVCLSKLGRLEEAFASCRKALELAPDDVEILDNAGLVLHRLRRDEEALTYFDRAIALNPSSHLALYNRARSLLAMLRLDEAMATYLRVKELVPDAFAIERGIEQINLLTGNFEAGWAKRETQWKAQVRPGYYPHFNQPIWLGEEPIEGKTLLIYADEGLGDTIHFARYVPMVAARGAHVILVVDNPLHPLLSALPGVSQCLPKSSPADTWPSFDIHCPICSLPLAFPRSLDAIPSATPYLPLPEQSRVRAWEDRLGPHDKLRIGLAWSGNPAHDNDHNRSIPLQMFSDLLDADATFVSLQPNASDKPALQESRIVDLTAHLTDFVETAALVSCLDLVITVDTSVAHLAGALARPTWILLPYKPDYRWLLNRDDSPWYPTAKLFRQNESRDYASVLKRARDELQARISAFRPEVPSR